MSIPGSVNPLFLGAAGQATGGGEYQIERSVRFNSPDSAYPQSHSGISVQQEDVDLCSVGKAGKAWGYIHNPWFTRHHSQRRR
jgi:hypothetical protein